MIDAPPPPSDQSAIVITARALEDSEADRAHGIERIERDRLAREASGRLDQVLKDVAGLQLFRRSDARSGHPTSQGVTMRALGGNASSRALVILDGVPQADPFGGWINWPAYDPAALASVRIVRGGGSLSAGPGALAGIIDMTSGISGGLDASLFGGSRQSIEARASGGLRAGAGQLGISLRGERGDGFIPVTSSTRGPADRAAPYEAANGRALWVGPIAEAIDVQISASAFTDRRDRGVDFTGNRTKGADASLRLVGRGGSGWSALVYGQWRDLRSSFASVGAGRATAVRASLQDEVPSFAVGGAAEWRPTIHDLDLRLGADTRLAQGESRELFSYVAGAPTRRRVAGGNSLTAGLFAEGSYRLGAATLSAGARADRWQIGDGKLREWVIATGAPLRDDRFTDRGGWMPTGRIGLVAPIDAAWSVRGAAYTGWRLPTLNELFRPFRAGTDATAANPLLKPERVSGVDVGADFRRDPLRLSLTAFANRMTDPIANVTLAQGPGTFPGVGFVGAGGEYRQRQNLGGISVRGVEASGELKLGKWGLRGSASLADAKVRAGGLAESLNGRRPAQTPRFSASAGVDWEDGGRILSLTLRHVGAQFEDDLNQRRLRPATTVDGFAAWPLGGSLDVMVRGENLLDEVVVAGIGGDGAVERATPRTVWIGVRVRASR